MLKPFAAIVGLCALGGCGGGSVSGGGPAGSVGVQPLTNTAVAGVSNVQLAHVTLINGTPGATAAATGTLDRQTQGLTLGGVVDAATPNQVAGGATRWTKGDVTVTKTTAGGLNGVYDYFAPVTVTLDGGGTVNPGVVGVQTPAGDMPSNNTATFTGEANATVLATTGSGSLSGNVTVTADFASRDADIAMTGFTGGSISGVTIDNAHISGAAIGADAGTSATLAGGAPLGAGALTTSVDGSFYGLSNGQPEEAAGVFVITGSEGTVSGLFAAGERQ